MKIRVEELQKRYSGVKALDGVSLDLDEGKLVTVLGPNGAGKTTLLRCLAGMVIPDKGRILFDGKPFKRDSVEQRRRFHFMPDFPTLFPDKTVIRNLSILLRLYERDGAGMEDRLVELLEEFDLLPFARHALGELSRGQAYKAMLVGLVAADPEVWLLDEPFASGMDPHGINVFKRLARDAVERGRTVVYTTQILEVAERFSDRVCVIAKGRVVAHAPLAELVRDSGSADGALQRLFDELREQDLATGRKADERDSSKF